MTPAELAQLKAMANAATPGPWGWEDGEMKSPSLTNCRCENDDHRFGPIIETDSGVYGPCVTDRAYIAAMHPQTTLALIAEVGRLREAGRDVVSAYTETAFNGGSQAAVALGEAVENMRQTLGEP